MARNRRLSFSVNASVNTYTSWNAIKYALEPLKWPKAVNYVSRVARIRRLISITEAFSDWISLIKGLYRFIQKIAYTCLRIVIFWSGIQCWTWNFCASLYPFNKRCNHIAIWYMIQWLFFFVRINASWVTLGNILLLHRQCIPPDRWIG